MDDAHRIASGLRLGLYLDRGGRAGLYYVVTAQNAAGESGPSNTAQARGIAPPRLYWPDSLLLLPAPLLLVALGRSRRRLRWAAPVGAVLMVIAVICVGAALLSGRGAEAEEPVPVQFQQQPEGYLTRTITYTYDPLGRLTGAEYSTGERYEYAYDAVGNRTAYTGTTPLAGTAVTTYTYDAANRLLISSSPQRLITYTWDARGDLIGDGTFTYTYNAAGRLVRAQSITATVVYTYTADGLRVGQSVNGDEMTFTWDLVAGLAQVLATGDGARDVYGLGRIAEVRGGAWAYPLGDALGSVRQWTDDAGNVTYAAGYAPYGETLWQVGSTQSAWGFTGEWQDAALELTYLRARWLDSHTGRFTQRDPLATSSFYRYASNNPINRVDPTGYIDWPTCSIQGDYGTCMIWDGDTYYKIGREIIAAGIQADLGAIVADIIALNPQYPNPNYIRVGDLLTLRAEWILAVINSRQTPPVQPPAPMPEPPPVQPPRLPPMLPPVLRPLPGPYRYDNFTGYLEGKGARASLLALNLLAGGREVVYDFVNLRRATFTYRQLTEPPMPCGVAFELASLGVSGYVGFVHFPAVSGVDHFSKYAGEAVSLSVGVGLIDLGKISPRLQGWNVSGELSAFASTPGSLLGIPGVDLSNPYYGAAISLSGGASKGFRPYSASVIYLNYEEIKADRVPYLTAEDMARDIRAGVGSPVSAPRFLRDLAADHLLWMWGKP